jgi:hypothetical protein
MAEAKQAVLDKLKSQRAKLDARIQAAEAREKSAKRKQDARRKILVGAYYLDQAEKNKSMKSLTQLLDGYLTRDSDRALFGLPLKAKQEEQK